MTKKYRSELQKHLGLHLDPDSESVVMEYITAQCLGTTQLGLQCRKPASDFHDYCHLHNHAQNERLRNWVLSPDAAAALVSLGTMFVCLVVIPGIGLFYHFH